MEVGKRFMDVFAYSGLSRLEFADRLKISPAVLSHISSGRNQPSLDLILALRRAYPEVSLDWLLLGAGSMKGGQTDNHALFVAPQAIEPEPAPLPLAPALPVTSLQDKGNLIRGEKEITDVKIPIKEAIPLDGRYQESIMALRIALQMHQQWMEQQLTKLENELKGEE